MHIQDTKMKDIAYMGKSARRVRSYWKLGIQIYICVRHGFVCSTGMSPEKRSEVLPLFSSRLGAIESVRAHDYDTPSSLVCRRQKKTQTNSSIDFCMLAATAGCNPCRVVFFIARLLRREEKQTAAANTGLRNFRKSDQAFRSRAAFLFWRSSACTQTPSSEAQSRYKKQNTSASVITDNFSKKDKSWTGPHRNIAFCSLKNSDGKLLVPTVSFVDIHSLFSEHWKLTDGNVKPWSASGGKSRAARSCWTR